MAFVLPLCGCSDYIEQKIAACTVKAIELYKPELGAGLVQGDRQSAWYVYYCMRAAGYEMDTREPCDQIPSAMLNGFCWHRSGWFLLWG